MTMTIQVCALETSNTRRLGISCFVNLTLLFLSLPRQHVTAMDHQVRFT